MSELSKEVIKALEDLNNAVLYLEGAVDEKNRAFDKIENDYDELLLKYSKIKPEVVKITTKIDGVINFLKNEG